MIPVQVVVIAKTPSPGRTKTRLTPPYTPGQAAALAGAALADTLDVVARVPAERRVLALDGAPTLDIPPDFEVMPQRGDGLDERLAAGFADAYAALARPVLLVGMDTPQLTPALVNRAVAGLEAADAVVGPAADGGFWLLGLRVPDDGLIRGVPMSTSHTGRDQRLRLRRAGLRVGLLPVLTDVDTAADVRHVAAAAPRTRFATLATALGGSGSGRLEGGGRTRSSPGRTPAPTAPNGSRTGASWS